MPRSQRRQCGESDVSVQRLHHGFLRRVGGSAAVVVLLPSLTLVAGTARAQGLAFTKEQLEVGRVVYQVGREVRASERAMLAAFEAGLVEADMQANPQPCEKDHDSAGLFQQRRDWISFDRAPRSEGEWCTTRHDARLFPRWAVTAFFRGSARHPGALYYDARGTDADGNSIRTSGQLAQATQVSAYPERYDQRASQAQALLHLVSRDAVELNPYTPEETCGQGGFNVVDWTLLRDSGYVFLLWRKDSRENCVVTIKFTGIGEVNTMRASLQIDGKAASHDRGQFRYYAGPVGGVAPSCIKWGGAIGSDSYDSARSHCGS